ncbi:MAG: NifB/NifX family molybdenum-iron cluster-binding protein [Lentisphaeria bacterium]|nr:NifB/NifX family molybdenum-iron cluster-binding protein [Lentisphaeria bacterium]
MKIAVSCTQDQVAPSLGMTAALAIFEVENGTVRRTVHRVCADPSPQAVAAKLLADDVDMILCNRVSPEAGKVLTEAGIMFIAGISGAPRTVVERYLDGTLPLDGGC